MEIDFQTYMHPRSLNYGKVIELTEDESANPHYSVLTVCSLALEGGFGVELIDLTRSLEMARRAADTALDAEDLYAAIPLARYGLMLHNAHDLDEKPRAGFYIKKARDRLQSAARGGSPLAMTFLGMMYNEGVGGLLRSPRKGAEFLSAAAEIGEPFGQMLLADQFNRGKGVDQNRSAVLKWHSAAAEQGLVTSQYSLGFYYAGSFVEKDGTTILPKDWDLAYTYLSKAALQNYPLAQRSLGIWHEKNATKSGLSDEKKLMEEIFALHWNEMASDFNIHAAIKTGQAYAHGVGAPPDPVKAYRVLANVLLRDGKRLATALPDAEQRREIEQELKSLEEKAAHVINDEGMECLDWGDNYEGIVVIPKFPNRPQTPLRVVATGVKR